MSPILANIYLHEFDVQVGKWCEEYQAGGEKRRITNEYRRLQRQLAGIRGKLDGKTTLDNGETRESLVAELRELSNRRNNMKVGRDDWIRIRYVRYADDWIIGVTGPRWLADEIKSKATEWLNSQLRLELSPDKTLITHATKGEAKFLGTRINANKGFNKRMMCRGRPTTMKSGVGVIKLKAPINEIITRLADKHFFRKSDKFPQARRNWIALEEWQIVQQYNAILSGILNYYSFCSNRGELGQIAYILKFSLAHTLANRRRTSVSKVLRAGDVAPSAFRMTKQGRKKVVFMKPDL